MADDLGGSHLTPLQVLLGALQEGEAAHSTVNAAPVSALQADLTGELGLLTPRSTLSLSPPCRPT